MLRIFFKTAWRQLWNNKVYSGINILGLAVGIGVAALSALWAYHHWQYDRFHENGEDLFQVMIDHTFSEGEMNTFTSVPLPLVEVLREEIPGVEQVAAIDWGQSNSLVVGEQRLRREGHYVEPDFLRMMSFPLLQGDMETALTDPNSILLSETLAQELFGEQDPIGQMINLDNAVNLQVTGILADVPEQSSWQFDYLMPYSLYETRTEWVADARNSWDNNSFQILLQKESATTTADLKARIRNIIVEASPDDENYVNLHALNDWHLRSRFVEGEATTGRIVYVRLFMIIGILVLMIACVNFINLSTARAEKRGKEVGVRKAIGANRQTLILQFLGEAGQTMLLAVVFGLALVQWVLPAFNLLVEESISIPWQEPGFWAIGLGVFALTTLLAGSYPAFYLTRFEAKEALQKTFQTNKRGSAWSRRILVSGQFALSIALIAASLVVHKQVRYAQDRDMGYEQERLLSVLLTPDIYNNYEPLKTELLSSGMVENVSAAGSPITSIWSNMSDIGWPGQKDGEEESFAFISTNHDYFETMKMDFVQGRGFEPERGADTTTMVINEAAVERMGLEDPLGASIRWGDSQYQVIGVVKDVIMTSPYEPVRPTIFAYIPDWMSAVFVRLEEDVPTDQALAALHPIFEKHDPATPFTYEFVEETYARKFSGTSFIGTTALLFAGLAIFLSSLGLLGLAIYLAERRAREISIRKVLGASVAQLWMLLSREFMLLIAIGGLIAVPLGGYFLMGWLEDFSYRIELPWMVFALSCGIALFIALATISVQSLKAAWANPAQRLRRDS